MIKKEELGFPIEIKLAFALSPTNFVVCSRSDTKERITKAIVCSPTAEVCIRTM